MVQSQFYLKWAEIDWFLAENSIKNQSKYNLKLFLSPIQLKYICIYYENYQFWLI